MDRLYVLWALLAVLFFENYMARDKPVWLFLGVGSIALSVLSKETAVVLPVVLLAWPILQSNVREDRRYWAVFGATSFVVGAYMLWRLPALMKSLSGAATATYSVSLHNIPDAVQLYLAFPFLPQLADADGWNRLDDGTKAWGLVVHLAVVGVLCAAKGMRASVAYCFVYIVLLAPVLVIAGRGAHYLYGPGLALATVMGALLTSDRFAAGTRLIGVALFALTTLHSLHIQGFAHHVGACTTTAWKSAIAAYAEQGRPNRVLLVADYDAEAHMLDRLFTNRTNLGEDVAIYLSQSAAPPDAAKFRFDANCVVSATPTLSHRSVL